jgi:hypothetical protein
MQSARVSVISPVISPGNNIFPFLVGVAIILVAQRILIQTGNAFV